MREQSSNIFTGVMDKDSALELVSRDDYRDAVNILNGYGAQPGKAVTFRGTEEIPFDYPAGLNKCLGAFENKQRNTLFFFLWNSSNEHTVWEYDPETEAVALLAQGAPLGFEQTRLIHSAAIVDGKLLIWTDGFVSLDNDLTGNAVGKINTDKAKLSGKKVVYELYAGVPGEGQFPASAVYTFTIKDKDGATVHGPYNFVADGAAEDDPAAGFDWLEGLIQSVINPGVDKLLVENCACKLELTVWDAEHILEVTSTNSDIILVPVNYYGQTLNEQFFSLVKRPPLSAPTVGYVADPTVSTNSVEDLCAQFRVRYIYDDGEKSMWGPISDVASNTNLLGEVVSGLNAIEVSFSEAILSDPDWLTMIREVEVAWRNGNTGDFFLVKRIPVCELGLQAKKILFHNDRIYPSIPSDDDSDSDVQVLQSNNWAPTACSSVEVSSDEKGNSMLFLGGTMEGRDCPDCLEMDFVIEELDDPCLIDVIGTVTIVNNSAFLGDNPDYVPAGEEAGDYYPLGGFVVYIAGTNYYGVSNNPADGSGDGSFTIKNVPRGRYKLRVASQLCLYGNKNGSLHDLTNGTEWQRSSAPCIDVAGSVAAESRFYERTLDLTGATDTFDLDTQVGYGDIKIQNMHLSRFPSSSTPTGSFVYVKHLDGYLLDNNGLWDEDDQTVYDQRRSAINCELQKVDFYYPGSVPDPYDGPLVQIDCDHNGFFWWQQAGAVDYNGGGTLEWTDGSNDFRTYVNGYKGLTEGNLAFQNNIGIDGPFRSLLLFNKDADWAADHRGTAIFNITDANNKPLAGVLCGLHETGRMAYTSSQGIAKVIFFSDAGSTVRTAQFIITYPSDYCYNAAFSQPFGQNVNCAGDPDTATVTLTIPVKGGVSAAFKHLKRGGVYKAGVLYMDDFLRTCGAVYGTDIRVPFPDTTEQYLPLSFAWEIHSKPPEWATQFRIVLTKESYYQRYIQWIPDEVQYVRIENVKESPINTTYSAGNATHILIKINNPLDSDPDTDAVLFFQRYSQQSGYQPMDGDQLRIVTDENGLGISPDGSVVELPVVGSFVNGINYYAVVEAQDFGSELKDGFLIEFVTPNQVEPEIYFEMGPIHAINTPGVSGVHTGDLQNQIYPGTPARGYLNAGDTYWRYKTWSDVGSSGAQVFSEHRTLAENRAEACSDAGRVYVENKDYGERFFYNRIRHTDFYLPDTKINGLSTFRALSYQDINRDWGSIKKLAFAHNVLLAICRFKVQPVYIGKGRLLSMDGTVNVGRSAQILNIADEVVSDAGTEHPESVVVEDGYAYWWDVKNGTPWRYAVNGVNPINNKMIAYFKQLGADRLYLPGASPSPGTFDRVHKQWILTCGGFGEVESQTLGFDEVKNGWASRYTFTPENYGRVGLELFSFKNGRLYRHFTGDNYANFYGVQWWASIRFISNNLPRAEKIFWSTRVRANAKPFYFDIVTPANYNYVNGMRSRLRAERWSPLEGAYWADLLRDMYDPSAEFEALGAITSSTRQKRALLKGRPLRGEVLDIDLRPNDPSSYFEVQSADVYFSPSLNTHP